MMNIKALVFATAAVAASTAADNAAPKAFTTPGLPSEEDMKAMVENMKCMIDAYGDMCDSCEDLLPGLKDMCTQMKAQMEQMENGVGRRRLQDGSPLDLVMILTDEQMKKYCAKGGCANTMLTTLSKMKTCMEKMPDMQPDDMPSDADMKKVMTGMCSSNPSGEYCAKRFAGMEKYMNVEQGPSCAELAGLGCCAGDIVEMLSIMDESEDLDVKAEATKAFTDCGYKGVPQSCPKPGESSDNVKFEVELGDGADFSDSDNKDKFVGDLATELAAKLGVTKDEILVVVNEATKKVEVYVTPKNDDTAGVVTTFKEKATEIGTAATKAAADTVGGGEVKVPTAGVKTETQTNEGEEIAVAGSDSGVKGSGASVLIGSALVASVVTLFA